MKSATLYYREGSSDKVYQVALEPQGGQFTVNFAYGRRGSTLNTGTKTPSPVDEETATQLFEKLVREKQAKGYTTGADGTPYQNHGSVTPSGLLPQLLNPVSEEELAGYLADPNWCLQEKIDGQRLLIRQGAGEAQGSNRRGLVTNLPLPLAQEVQLLGDDLVIDGESVGDTCHVFDLLEQNGQSLRHWPYQRRMAQLERLISGKPLRCLRLLPTTLGEQPKRAMLKELRLRKAEGIVLKQLDAPSVAGRPASGGTQLKHKFYATASCLAGEVNPGKRSVRLVLLEAGQKVYAGNVTIPPNQRVPEPGTVVEVRYLYAHLESGALYQPVFLGARSDVLATECLTSQLKRRSALEETEQ